MCVFLEFLIPVLATTASFGGIHALKDSYLNQITS
jgi:hypothetical protein